MSRRCTVQPSNAQAVRDLCDRLDTACAAAGLPGASWSPAWLDGRTGMVDWEGLALAAATEQRPVRVPPQWDAVRALTTDPAHRDALAAVVGAASTIRGSYRATWWRLWVDATGRRVHVEEIGTCHLDPRGHLVHGVAWRVTVPLTAGPRVLARLAAARAGVAA